MPHELPLILASSSPRRKRLLIDAGFVFEIMPPDAQAEDERRINELPKDYVQRLAFQKANNTADKIKRGLILGGDTIVMCKGNILGKPTNRDDARNMLKQLCGQEHEVLSGLCLLKKEISRETTVLLETNVTRLVMQPISDDDIESYLHTEQWQGKAGAFGYQDGNDWITILEGSESNVVGLPIELFQAMYRIVQERDIF